MSSKKDYTREIIEEYNVRLHSWGNSDSWGLTEFKMLEDLIYESSRMRINANTLKRFFHQRTSNPQVATTNALCVFLGYSGYTEFVTKKIQKEKKQATETQKEDILPETNTSIPDKEKIDKEKTSGKKYVRHYITGSIISILIIAGVLSQGKISRYYKDKLTSKITFTASNIKGTSPLTVKFEYDIPNQLFDSIYVEFRESNGELIVKKLNKDQHEIYMTYIYPGRGTCQLKYGKQVLKTISVEARTPGWSTCVRDDHIDFYRDIPFKDVLTDKGYISLPKEKIPKEADTEKLFVSYTYYAQNIIDGDNFIYEARVRNSAQDYGIPCYDVMLYAFSDSLLHCFSLNQSCYSYLKFVSGNETITGDKHDLSRFKFNPAYWHNMCIEVINKQTTFFLDDKVVLKMKYEKSVGSINELTMRFKGCGAVDYVKIMDLKHKVIYENNFDEVTQ